MPIWPDLEAAGQRYEPSNGTEGDCFHDKWCCNCARDKVMNGTVEQDGPGFNPETDYCQILNASFRSEAVEWIFDANGMPSCTAPSRRWISRSRRRVASTRRTCSAGSARS